MSFEIMLLPWSFGTIVVVGFPLGPVIYLICFLAMLAALGVSSI